jgi:L-alanine-DL-glutamate epimerase-like enolase superfamily enzyme
MSIFSSQTTWPPQCLSANQSPINLSQSSAKPCEVTCDLVMDDGYITVPNKPGIGVEPDIDFLESITTSKEVIK